jgi:hypothetical protein
MHDCRRKQVSAERDAEQASEDVGLLHSALAMVCSADNPSSLSDATSNLASTLESLDGARKHRASKDKAPLPEQEGGRGLSALTRLRGCTLRAAAAGLGEGRGSAGGGGGRPSILQRNWPELALLSAVVAFAPQSMRPAQVWPLAKKLASQAKDGAATVYKENLKGPLKVRCLEIMTPRP